MRKNRISQILFRPIFLIVAVGLTLTCRTQAVNILQLYIEGATYDTDSETWVASGGDTFRLWAIGNVAGDGGKGTIEDVKLSIAYISGETPTISLTSSTTGGFGGFTDPSTPSDPVFSQTVTDGSSPLLGDGSPLPSHGIYGTGTDWVEYNLGDFNLTDSPGGDFSNSLPTPVGAGGFQINVYEVSITGTDFVHFDLYNHYFKQNGDAQYKFAPFSHDAEHTHGVPDGGSTVMLLGMVLVGFFAARRFKLVKA